ncbi:MAG: hypothetical protein R3A46_02845 [Thermomicrobiales bacterium]
MRITNDDRGSLRAPVTIEQPEQGSLTMPVSTTEGIVIAWRNKCPIRIEDHALARIRGTFGYTGKTGHRDTSSVAEIDPNIDDFIQSLDVDWPDDPGIR